MIFTSLPEEPTARAGLWLRALPVILSKVVTFIFLTDTPLHHKSVHGSVAEGFHSIKEPTNVPSALGSVVMVYVNTKVVFIFL